MMTPAELRIGNWITVMGSLPSQVTAHFLYMMETYTPVDPDDEADYKEMTNPIPLTGEWLVKLGFKKKIKQLRSGFFELWICRHGVKGISLNCYPAGYFLSSPRRQLKVQYVHQLQNLYYALTGEELTIKEDQP